MQEKKNERDKVEKMSDYRKQPGERRKQIIWVGKARLDLAELPDAIKEHIGYQLRFVEAGEMPADFKPMPTVGDGVYEIRVPDEDGRNVGRCFFIAKIEGCVAVLHSFVKTSEKTSKPDLDKGRNRYKVLNEQLKKKNNSSK